MKLKKIFGVVVLLALGVVVFNACKDDDDARDAFTGTYKVQVSASAYNGVLPLVDDTIVKLTVSKKGDNDLRAKTSFELSKMPISVDLTFSALTDLNGAGYTFNIEKQAAASFSGIKLDLEGTKDFDGHDGIITNVAGVKFLSFTVQGEVAGMGAVKIEIVPALN
jgi:hypothetical protein